MNTLRLRYLAEDHQHGELFATVTSGEFGGTGSAWFKIDALWKFLEAIGAHPIRPGDEPTLEGGFYDDAGETLLQRHLGVRLSPKGRLGSVCVTVRVSTQADRDEEQDLQQSLISRFVVDYGDVDRFRADLASMLEGKSGDALLVGRS